MEHTPRRQRGILRLWLEIDLYPLANRWATATLDSLAIVMHMHMHTLLLLTPVDFRLMA
jgi:hypothetical protein